MAVNKINTGSDKVPKEFADQQVANKIALGIVKNNIDSTRTGKIQVQLINGGGADADDSTSWTTVEYMSPFLGTTSPGGSTTNGPDKTGDGKFVGNPQSYGFWASAPDIGTLVMCIFTDSGRGFYIGGVPQSGMVSMIPAIGSSNKVVPNDGEASTYGGADRLPTTELNASNPSNKNSAQPYEQPKPVHSYQAGVLANQGLIRDNIRGVIGSSAQRETPSRVFGLSTPGSQIFEGGYNASTIAAAAAAGDDKKLKVLGRTGGHTFVMDDGTVEGADQLIRLRSSAGHQILMSDSGQALFIIHSNGLSWIELGKEGTIDVFATNSFNVRTKGDLNLHADNDVNINAGKKLNIFGEQISIESEKDSTWRSGGNFSGYTMGNYTFKIDGSMGLQSAGESGINSAGTLHMNGSKININSGTKGPSPATVPKITKTNHVETTFSKAKGWMFPAPEGLSSVTSRAPTHQPWIGSGSGVNVKINDVAPSADAPTTSPAVEQANKATTQPGQATAKPTAVTTPAEVAAAPTPKASAGPLPAEGVKAMTAQVATAAQALPVEAQKAAGVVSAASGLTAKQMETAGVIPPGAGEQVQALMAKGLPAAKALEGKLTGVEGASSASSLVTDITKQASIVQSAISESAKSLLSAGVLTGKESPMQAGGPILAGVTNGVKNVTELLSNKAVDIGSTVVSGKLSQALGVKVSTGDLTSLKDSLVSGKLSAQLGENISGGLSGLKTSLEGMGDKLKGEVDNMKSGLQNAFASVEASFPALKGGKPNVLGAEGAQPAEKSEVEKAGASYDSAKAEYESAETEWYQAKRDYSYSKDPEDYDRITDAEQKMSSAKQAMTKASTAFLKSVPGGSAIASAAESASNGLSSIASKASALGDNIKSALSGSGESSTKSTGLNALPGGAGALMAQINNAGDGASNPLDKMKSMASGISTKLDKATDQLKDKAFSKLSSAADAKLPGLSAAIKDPSKLGGTLMAGMSSKVEGALGGKLAALTGDPKSAASAAKGMMAQLQASLDAAGGPGAESKSAVAATGTFDMTALKAKMGTLFGDAKIPVPTFSDSITPSAEAEKITAEQTAALEAVKEAQYKVNSAKLNLRLTKMSPLPTEQKSEAVEKAIDGIKTAEATLEEAQKAYSDVINKQA
jgi:hypothetical protein